MTFLLAREKTATRMELTSVILRMTQTVAPGEEGWWLPASQVGTSCSGGSLPAVTLHKSLALQAQLCHTWAPPVPSVAGFIWPRCGQTAPASTVDLKVLGHHSDSDIFAVSLAEL